MDVPNAFACPTTAADDIGDCILTITDILKEDQRSKDNIVFNIAAGVKRTAKGKESATVRRATPGRVKFIALPKETKKSLVDIFSYMKMEIIYGIYKGADVNNYTKNLKILTQRMLAALEGGDFTEAEIKDMIARWINRYKAHHECFGIADTSLAAMTNTNVDTLMQVENKERLITRIKAIQSDILKLLSVQQDKTPIYYVTAADCLPCPTRDFQYPNGMSLFELAVLEHASRKWSNILENVTCIVDGNTISSIYDSLVQKFSADLRQIVQAFTVPLSTDVVTTVSGVELTAEFFDSCAEVFANYVLALSVRIFNKACSITSNIETTPINYAAFMDILRSTTYDRYDVITPEMSEYLCNLFVHNMEQK